jgi:hypothetical protein
MGFTTIINESHDGEYYDVYNEGIKEKATEEINIEE